MDSTLLDLGFFQIQWYSILIFLGLFFGGLVAMGEAKRFRIGEDFLINLFFYLIPIALIGARLYYVLFNWSYYEMNKIEIIQVWRGGLAIHGGIIFGLLWILYYTKKYNVEFIRMLDILVVGLLLGHAIGRWGNFFNQEAYGSITTIETLQSLLIPNFIIEGMFINGNYHHPTFLYESLGLFIGFLIIFFLRRMKTIKKGNILSFYLIWYGILRFFIEILRTDSLMLGNFKVAQIVSLIMVAIGVIMFIKSRRGSVFENLYNDWRDMSEVSV